MSLAAVPSQGPDSTTPEREDTGSDPRQGSPVRVLILSSVMLSFIGVWSTAAVVLCDLASTAYYIGGVVESQIGKAAPWFILAVMIFSYAVRSVYIESCAMFVRGGVYRIVRETMGHGMAKVAVSALMFDYILTGPISAVSAGHYLVKLLNSLLTHFRFHRVLSERWCAIGVAIAVVLYFFQSNLRGIQSSSSKAIKIMCATTVMVVVMVAWCLLTLAIRPETRALPPLRPELSKKVDVHGQPIMNEVTKEQQDPLGWIADTRAGDLLRPGKVDWLSMIGAIGIVIAFGHSILAMSGEETLAQVYREVKAPKLTNFKWVAFIVFVYSMAMTGLISFFAVMIIPDEVRAAFADNLISGLALHVVGPAWARLGLNAMVVIVGFLILAGSVNTSIVGANGVLNRVAEDGVLPAWFQRPLKTSGTTWRLLTLIAGLQVATIVVTGGDVILLGEAYAFGVVWSLTLMSLSMLVMRFTEPNRPREYRVPINIRLGRYEWPLGLTAITLVLFAAAVANLLSKTVATISGLAFSGTLLAVFTLSEWYRKRADDRDHRSKDRKHLEQFRLKPVERLLPADLGIDRSFRALVWLRAVDKLKALETCLIETDPDSTDIVVVAAHPAQAVSADRDCEQEDVVDEAPQPTSAPPPVLADADRELMTAVVKQAERAGKPVKTMVLESVLPENAVVRAACDIDADALFFSPTADESPETQLERIVAAWRAKIHTGTRRRTVRMIEANSDTMREVSAGRAAHSASDDGGETARALANDQSD